MDFNNDKLSWEISNYLLEMGYVHDDDYNGAYDWLNLCTNIKSIEFHIGKYDEGLLYCGSEWDYVSEQTDIWEKINIKLVQFNYAWCALESIVDLQVDESIVTRCGKINATCLKLKQYLPITNVPIFYTSMYEIMIDKLRDNSQFDEDLRKLGITSENYYPNRDCANETGAGLLVTYKIRNKLAHGSWRFPNPNDYEDKEEVNIPELIDYATLMVLLAIVMLLLVDCVDFDDIVDDATYCPDMIGKKPSEYLKELYQMCCQKNN